MAKSEEEILKNRIIFSVTLLVLTISTGTAGYTLLEGWDLFDSFYMTVITLSTVGYQETHTLSTAGRLFTIFLVFTGLGVVAYTANYGIRFILEGEIQHVLGRRKMEKRIKAIKNHYIVCGYGRMGQIICKELKSSKKPFVVVESREIEFDGDENIPFITGDATRDENLRLAGIERAKGLVSVLSTDAHNLYVVLSARGLNEKLQIVARATEEGAEQKFIRAGADRVVSPYHIGGLRIAHSIIKPSIVDFLEFATRSGNIELQMEEIPLLETSRLPRTSIIDAGIGKDLGVIIVAIKREGNMIFNPTGKTIMNVGDILIALGEATKLKKLEEIAQAS